MICDKCGSENSRRASYYKRECRSCGMRNDPDSSFCENCGARLSADISTTSPVRETPKRQPPTIPATPLPDFKWWMRVRKQRMGQSLCRSTSLGGKSSSLSGTPTAQGPFHFLAYIAPDGKLVTAVSFCEPCRSTRFHVVGYNIFCNTCGTT